MSASDSRISPGDHSASNSRLPVILALIWLLAFCAVFFQLDLPNQNGVNRLHIWAERPFLLLNMLVQHPDFPEASWAFLPQRFPFMLAASVAWFGAWGLGQLVLRFLRVPLENRSLERFVLGCGVGLSGLSLVVLSLGLLAQWIPGAISRSIVGGLTLLFGVAEAVLVIRSRPAGDTSTPAKENAKTNEPPKSRTDEKGVLAGGQISFHQLARVAAGIGIALFVIALSLGAMLPPLDFDVREYHLGGPKEYFQNGFISLLPHNVYTSFPFLTEMLSLLGMILCDDWYEGAHAGKLIISAFAPLTALAVFAAARRWFGELAAWSAALIHISTPWTYRISIIAYAEGGLTFYLFASLLAVLLTLDGMRQNGDVAKADSGTTDTWHARPSLLVLCGLLAGSGMACKYPGVLQVVVPLGVALLWFSFDRNREGAAKRVLKTGLFYSIGVLVAVGPWLLKNLCETGNPVYPLLQSVFHGADWTPTLEANWKGAHSPAHHDPADFFVKLFDVTFKSDWLSPLLFSLAPFALLASRSRAIVKGLWLYVAFLFLSWWVFTHRIDRFWIPMIPVVALLAGAGIAWSRDVLWQRGALAIVTVCVVFNLGFISTTACGLNEWLRDLDDSRKEATLKSFATMNQMLDSSKVKILMVGEAQIFDARFPLIYNTVFDISIFEQWCSAAEPDTPPAEQPMKPAEELRQRLIDEGVTHVFVNWQEVLRYRMTYGYTEFVAPHRFVRLSQEGVFAGTPLSIGGVLEVSKMGEAEQADIRKWAPELIVKFEGKEYFVLSQLYTVRK
ncbi:MAG: hypothetical protein H8E37_07015 [Planctomycetes bacterium]|nr:hypothetical protein [Planctomycetota bacterium]